MNTRTKGNKGEDIACIFLKKRGFSVVDRNYLKKWGELDIVAEKDDVLHFFEVKSVVVLFFENQSLANSYKNSHKPEENVHAGKSKKLRRIIQTYLSDRGGGLDREFQFHVLCVYMNVKTSTARLKWLENIIL